MFPTENKKNEHHRLIQHFRITLCSKFQVNLSIFFFFEPNLLKKDVSNLKQ